MIIDPALASDGYITIHGIDTKLNRRVHLNYLTDSLATAWDKVEELHPDVVVIGHTLHLNCPQPVYYCLLK